MSSAWTSASTSTWRRVRSHVLAEDGWRCRVDDVLAGGYLPPRLRATRQYWMHLLFMSPKCTGPDKSRLVVHHLIGRRVSGDDQRYLLTTCSACNGHIGDPGRSDPVPTVVTRW